LVSVSEKEKKCSVRQNFRKVFEEPEVPEELARKVSSGFRDLRETKRKPVRLKEQKMPDQTFCSSDIQIIRIKRIKPWN
jgi:hypothetical protein